MIPLKGQGRTYMQFLEMINFSGFSQPSNLKSKSLYRKVELLDGLITVYGPGLNAGKNQHQMDDDE